MVNEEIWLRAQRNAEKPIHWTCLIWIFLFDKQFSQVGSTWHSHYTRWLISIKILIHANNTWKLKTIDYQISIITILKEMDQDPSWTTSEQIKIFFKIGKNLSSIDKINFFSISIEKLLSVPSKFTNIQYESAYRRQLHRDWNGTLFM